MTILYNIHRRKTLIKIIFNIINKNKTNYIWYCYEQLKNIKFLRTRLNVALFLCVIVAVVIFSMEATISTTPQDGTIHVSSSSELMSALSAATGGETIVLASGQYGDVTISNLKLPEEVTITSADSANPAEFNKVNVSGVENLTFNDIYFHLVPDESTVGHTNALRVFGSENIKVLNSKFEGGPAITGSPEDVTPGQQDPSGNIIGWPAGTAVGVNQSTNFTFDNNEVTYFSKGVALNGSGFVITNNEIHDLRSTPLRGGDVSDVLIEGNHFSDSHPWSLGGAGDHGDMVHFWTREGIQEGPSENIRILNNFFQEGDGEAILGIYLEDNFKLGYANVLIEGNVIHNGDSQGIRLENVYNSRVTNNTLLQSSGGENDAPGIVLKLESRDLVIENNILGHYTVDVSETAAASITSNNNLIVQRLDIDAPDFVGNFITNPLAANPTLADLKIIPGSIADQNGVGSPLTQFETHPETLSGFITSESGTGLNLLTQAFDATHFFGPEGGVDTSGAKVEWSFGDGGTAAGLNPSHTFVHAGEYTVSATVMLSDGRSATIDKNIVVETPIALSANFDDGAQDTSDIVNPVKVGEQVTFEPGLTGQAVRLNGGLVTYDAKPEFFNNSEYTLSFDFKKDAGAEDSAGRIINFSGSFVLIVESDGVRAAVSTSSGTTWLNADGIGIKDADWHRVALTFSGKDGAAKLYVDGAVVASASGLEGAVQVGMASHDFHLGDPWGQGFPGLIDNVAFLRGAMSAEQIQSWEQTWEAIVTPETPIEPNLAPEQSGQVEPDNILEDFAAPYHYAHLTEIVMDQSGTIVGGSAGDDLFTGSEVRDIAKGMAGDDAFFMGAGDDHVNAGDGDDEMHGGAGDDYLHGFAGYDTAYGGDGNDHIYANLAFGEAGDDQLTGENEVSDTFHGGEGNDQLIGFSGDDTLYGDAGDDRLEGGDGDDLLDGGDGADTIWAGSGNDIVFGGAGVDLIGGGAGNDLIDGGEGADKLGGGDGDDTFILDVLDQVHGHRGTDTLLFAEGDASDVDLSVLNIYSIEAVDMTNDAANTLSLGYRDITKSENDTLIIKGDAEDKVVLFQTMEHLGTVNLNGEIFEHYSYSQWSHYTELYVDADIQVEFPNGHPDAAV